MQVRLTLLLAALVCAGCSGGEADVEAPCARPWIVVDDDATLRTALEDATPGTCIVLREGTYAGPLVMGTADVTIASATGETAVVKGSDGGAGIEVTAEGVQIIGVDVEGGDFGVHMRARRGGMSLMDISATRRAAVGIKCEDQDCLRPTEMILLHDLMIHDGAYGLHALGARIVIRDSAFLNHRTQGLTGGAGIYIVGGADVTLERTTVDGNVYGIVADGAATRVVINGGQINTNDDGGLLAQGIDGTGSLAVNGTTLLSNGRVGISSIASSGVSIDNVDVRDTIDKPVSVDVMTTVDVGDGIGLFEGTSNVMITNTRLTNNDRAQAVVDTAGAGIVFDLTVMASGGAHNVVVQRSNETVAVSDTIRSDVPSPLFVRPDRIQVPSPP